MCCLLFCLAKDEYSRLPKQTKWMSYSIILQQLSTVVYCNWSQPGHINDNHIWSKLGQSSLAAWRENTFWMMNVISLWQWMYIFALQKKSKGCSALQETTTASLACFIIDTPGTHQLLALHCWHTVQPRCSKRLLRSGPATGSAINHVEMLALDLLHSFAASRSQKCFQKISTPALGKRLP